MYQTKIASEERKCHSKSVRMTPTVLSYIENHPGNGFNDKFQNIVLFCMKQLPELEKKIKEREDYLKDLDSRLKKHKELFKFLQDVSYYVQAALRTAKNNCNSIIQEDHPDAGPAA